MVGAICGTFKVGERKCGEFGIEVGKSQLVLNGGHFVAYGGGMVVVLPGKGKLKLNGKHYQIELSRTVTLGNPVLSLKGKTVRPVLPTLVSPGKAKLRTKGKSYTPKYSTKVVLGKATIVLRTKQIRRAGLAGLAPTQRRQLVLTPTEAEVGLLVPTEREDTLLVPTTRPAL